MLFGNNHQNEYPKLLLYIFLLYLIPGLGFTIISKNPFTGVNAMYAEGNRQLFYFGKFVTDFSQQEALSSPIKKAILQVGGHFLDTTMSKFLQINPSFLSIYSVPYYSSTSWFYSPHMV